MPLTVRSQNIPLKTDTAVQDENAVNNTIRPSLGKNSGLQTPRRALGDLGNKQGPGGSTVKRGFGKDLTNQSSQANNGSVKKRTGDSTKENHGSIRKHSEGARKKGLTTSRASKTILSLSPSKGVKHLKKDTQSTKAPKLSTMTPQAVVEDKQLGNSWEIEYAPKPEADVDDPITSDHGQYMEALIKPFKRTLSPPGPSPRASLTAPMRTVCRDDLSSDDDAPSAYGHFATSIVAAADGVGSAPLSVTFDPRCSDLDFDDFEVTI